MGIEEESVEDEADLLKFEEKYEEHCCGCEWPVIHMKEDKDQVQ